MTCSAFRAARPLILASGSPRRQEFFQQLGLEHRVVLPRNPEPRPEPGEAPRAYAARTATAKARDVAAREREAVVVAADTIVVLGQTILGKPTDQEHAVRMLQALGGKKHVVVTACVIILPEGRETAFTVESRVRVARHDPAVLRAYAATGESMDKAGGYAVQGRGAFLIESIDGSWSSVVGLPVAEVVRFLLAHGCILPAEGGA